MKIRDYDANAEDEEQEERSFRRRHRPLKLATPKHIRETTEKERNEKQKCQDQPR